MSAAHKDEARPSNENSPKKADGQAKPEQQETAPESKATEKEEGGQKQGGGKDEGDQGKRSRWPLIIGGIVLVLAIIGGGWYWWSHRDLESTDDAFTEGRVIPIAPHVSGYVTELAVTDNQLVHAGDLILRIEAEDFMAQRDQARAALSLARAQLRAGEIDLEVTRVRAPAMLEQAQAQLDSARAAQAEAAAAARRQASVDPRATTRTMIDTANATLAARNAAVHEAEAQLDVAKLTAQNIAMAEATVAQRRSQVAQAEAQLAQAETTLSYTEIRAPQDGRVTRRNVEAGSLVQSGATLMNLVTPEVWITANFKENQLGRMRPGQPVAVEVDAFPDLELHGHVDSIQMGSGARFSAFPAENATGNFVKIVRRVPVKIVIERGLPDGFALPLGLSVVPTVTLQ